MENIRMLKEIYLFSFESNGDLLDDTLLKNNLIKKSYKKGEIVHFQNELCVNLDIITKGKVSIQNIDENGNILIINVFKKTDIIGANLIFSKKNKYPMMVIASENTEIISIPKNTIISLSQKSKEFMLNFMEILSDRTSVLTNKISEISLKSVREKIIYFLINEKNIQNSNNLILKMSKKELAEHMGVQRTSLSRELNKMRKDGLIEFDSKKINIIKELNL